jgi:hypothetical protein
VPPYGGLNAKPRSKNVVIHLSPASRLFGPECLRLFV